MLLAQKRELLQKRSLAYATGTKNMEDKEGKTVRLSALRVDSKTESSPVRPTKRA